MIGIPVLVGLAGCATGPSDGSIARGLESSIVAAAPDANGAFVSFSSSGPSNRDVLVILYLNSSDPDTVAKAVDSGFSVAWKEASFTPVSVSVGAVQREKPEKPDTHNPDAIDPASIASSLGIASTNVGNQWINLSADTLIDRYGAREDRKDR